MILAVTIPLSEGNSSGRHNSGARAVTVMAVPVLQLLQLTISPQSMIQTPHLIR